MRVENFAELVQELKAKLPQYLEEHGINPTKKFSCPSPTHDDKTPSACLNPKTGNTSGTCFGCGKNFDIFTVANWLEGLPLEGPGFVKETLLTLSDRYGLQMTIARLSERERYMGAVYQAYSVAAAYITCLDGKEWPQPVEDYIAQNGWDKQALARLGIGVCTKENLQNHLLGAGYSMEYLREINLVLDTSPVTEEGRLIFTVSDEYGSPIAFTARLFDRKPKFLSTPTDGLKHRIFPKGETLYGLNWARKAIAPGKPIYIFEGYGDVVSAHLAGLKNCCAVMGDFLTSAQVDLIRKTGYRSLVLALDFDEAGRSGIERALFGPLAEARDLHISVLECPEGNEKDPGELIKSSGLAGLMKLEAPSSFSWLLGRRLKQEVSGPQLAQEMVGTIAAEPNAITREVQIRELARRTEVSAFSIEAEVRKLTDSVAVVLEQEESQLVDSAVRHLRAHPDERLDTLHRLVDELQTTRTKFSQGQYSGNSLVALLDEQQEVEKTSNKPVGFRLPLLPELEQSFSGGKDWSIDTLMILAGAENSGKSSMMSFWAANVASCPENDAIVIYFSIDDSARDIAPKFVVSTNALLENGVPTSTTKELSLGFVVNPGYWLKQGEVSNRAASLLLQRRARAFNHVKALAAEERLLLKDASDGTSLDYLEGAVRYYRGRYPSKRILAILDNIHNLTDYADADMRVKYTRVADRLNNICNKYAVCLLASAEYRKTSGQSNGKVVLPGNDDIAETRALKYRAKWIGHIYNDMHIRPDAYEIFHTHPVTGSPLPRILLVHGKTKINGYRGIMTYDFFPAQSAFVWKDPKEAKEEAKKIRAARKSEEEGKDEDW